MTRSATTYDAYVIHADEDIQFVLEMITQLETKFGLRLCISNRDMLAGAAHFAAIAALIKKRYVTGVTHVLPGKRHYISQSPLPSFLATSSRGMHLGMCVCLSLCLSVRAQLQNDCSD